MAGEEFFEAPEEQSVIKTMLVTTYFDIWAKIMLSNSRGRISYIDLFSGPGQYEDGSPSTPMWVLEYSIKDPKLCARLVTMFNDKNPAYAKRLETAIASLPGIVKLKHPPKVSATEIGPDVVEILHSTNLVPTLFFIDPFGYKGLSLDLIGNAIRSWGCDCIFFFNYNRINLAINNPAVAERMNDLFGATRANQLRNRVRNLGPDERQAIIVNELTEALKQVGGKFVLPFQFSSQHGDRTSHYIMFVSKAFLGYHLMKEAMANLSTDTSEVKRFEYIPLRSTQMALFPDFGKNYSIPLLKDVLVQVAAGMSLSVWDIYERFTVDTPYLFKHVQTALSELEAEARIVISPPAALRPKRLGKVTLARDKIVMFPS